MVAFGAKIDADILITCQAWARTFRLFENSVNVRFAIDTVS